MLADIPFILRWWSIFFLLGIISLPVTLKIFGKFWDLGYALSKIIGVLLVSYVVWLTGSLNILPFSRETILVAIAGWAVFNLVLLKATWLHGYIATRLKIFVGEEILFLVCLTFWAFIRGFAPDIFGLEKFMDFGFVNSILRTEFFPPADMWFAGGTINYYYFGHFVTALLTKLSGIDSAITYNLQLATLFALAFTAAFSLGANLLHHFSKGELRRIIFGGLLSAFLLTLGGNFHTIVYVLKNGASHYWYPDATRYIGYNPPTSDKTIHEFPIYSFVVSDLHGHVSDIPFVLLFLSLTFSLLISLRPKDNFKDLLKSSFPHVLLSSALLGIMYMTNSWDFPIYSLVLGLSLLYLNYRQFGLTYQAIVRTGLFSFCYLLFAILFSLPFHFHFSQMAKGIGLVRSSTPFYQLLVLWGFPWLINASFIVFLFSDKIKEFLKPEIVIKNLASFLGVKIGLAKTKLSAINLSASDVFVLILILVSTLLIVLPEILYVKDIYIPEYHRANTMFKLTYQAFMMYSVAAGYIIVRILSSTKKGQNRSLLFTCHAARRAFYLITFTFVMIYPYFAIKSYYGSLKNYQGLYGLNFLKQNSPDNFAAVLWFNQNVPGQPVILEAAGDSYTDYNQISMATGLPTIEGWLVHEWLWRGSFDEPGKRAGQVSQIYEGTSEQARALLDQYQVKYIIVGDLERKKYTKLDEDKFNSLGKVVFESGTTKIWAI
ncbi:hypothetical protein FJZ40_00685 [Candidatus Shapirobacteria bacterium]|nr:hypothetical protein [Candidatus Shapirobacteria bacterium]